MVWSSPMFTWTNIQYKFEPIRIGPRWDLNPGSLDYKAPTWPTLPSFIPRHTDDWFKYLFHWDPEQLFREIPLLTKVQWICVAGVAGFFPVLAVIISQVCCFIFSQHAVVLAKWEFFSVFTIDSDFYAYSLALLVLKILRKRKNFKPCYYKIFKRA